MLSLILIKNYTVVDELELEFEHGLSVLTGETGAGKSILVDALGLALGDRSDAATVRPGAKRAEINVVFDCPPDHAALHWLKERGLDDEDACVLRRLIGAEGRSRAFVNGQPVGLQDLKQLGALLIDIHGQHAHQSLLGAQAQRQLLDSFGASEALASATAAAFSAWRSAAADLETQRNDGDEREAQLELLRFQLSELEALALESGEVEKLASEHARLANMDSLVNGLDAALGRLYESDTHSAYALIVQARRQLEPLLEHDLDLASYDKQLGSAEIELKDAATSLMRYRDDLEPDPQRLEFVETRLAKIRSLARRHQAEEQALVEVAAVLRNKIEALESSHRSLDALQAEAERAKRQYFEIAEKLSAERHRAAGDISHSVSSQLKELGLPHGEFQVVIEAKETDRADATGLDRIEFQVQMNPGQAFGPLSRVASGGELSRVSLALEVVATHASTIPTYVFDEVDAGIGGGVAEIVGRRLRQIAQRRQVLCVTHLAQVASQGDTQYKVIKLSDGKTSKTQVRKLNEAERIEELSRMLGGLEITETTRAHAEEMMRRAR